MSELAGFGTGWLPASVQRRMALEDAAERRAARRDEAERSDRAEAAAEKALGAYRAAAEARGEPVSAMAIARGEAAGRSIEDVFADAIAAADHEDARQAAKAHREAGLEPDHVMVGRSDGWPESPYEADRLIRQAEENHRDLVRFKARHDYAGAEEAARSKQVLRPSAVRSAPHYGEITRVATPDGNVQMGDVFGNVIR